MSPSLCEMTHSSLQIEPSCKKNDKKKGWGVQQRHNSRLRRLPRETARWRMVPEAVVHLLGSEDTFHVQRLLLRMSQKVWSDAVVKKKRNWPFPPSHSVFWERQRRVLNPTAPLQHLRLWRVREEGQSVKRQCHAVACTARACGVNGSGRSGEWVRGFWFQQRTPPPSPVRRTQHRPVRRVTWRLSLPDWCFLHHLDSFWKVLNTLSPRLTGGLRSNVSPVLGTTIPNQNLVKNKELFFLIPYIFSKHAKPKGWNLNHYFIKSQRQKKNKLPKSLRENSNF